MKSHRLDSGAPALRGVSSPVRDAREGGAVRAPFSLVPFLLLSFITCLSGCSDSSLQPKDRDQPPAVDNLLSISGSLCTDAPEATNYPVTVHLGTGGCWFGGLILGTYPWHTPWDVYHRTAAFGVDAPTFSVIGVRIHNYGDGIQVRAGGTNFRVIGVHVSFNHDDCVQNDNLYSGTVTDSFFDGCYVGFSARPSANQVAEGRHHTWVISNSLVRLQPMPTVYKGDAPGTGGFFKWDQHHRGPRLVVRNTIFRADQRPSHQTLGVPSGYHLDCSHNIVVWLGKGKFPDHLPKCFRITRDRRVWDRAVTAWYGAHPANLSSRPLRRRATSSSRSGCCVSSGAGGSGSGDALEDTAEFLADRCARVARNRHDVPGLAGGFGDPIRPEDQQSHDRDNHPMQG